MAGYLGGGHMTLPNFSFPQTTFQFVDQNGVITTPWLQLLTQLFYRTGGTIPNIPGDDALQSMLTGLTAEIVSSSDVEGSALIGLMSQGFQKSDQQKAEIQSQAPASNPDLRSVLLSKAFEGGASGDVARSFATQAITVGASPYSYQAPSSGSVFISGGTVNAVAFSRDGTTFIGAGVTAGIVPVRKKDIVRVTYTVAPTMTFVPM